MDHVLPLRAAVRLFDLLSIADRNALVHAYPGLAHAYAKYRAARTTPWQARFPVEIAQDVLEYLSPSDYYAACCVCSFWRSCGMNARMLRAQLDVAVQNSCTSAVDLASAMPFAEDTSIEDLWLYFLVAAPRRYMFNDGMRRNRVVSLDFRRVLINNGEPGIFLSDYGGIIAVSSPTGLALHSIDDMLPNAYDTPPSAAALGTLQHPRGVLPSQLVDVSIAHQQGSTGQFHVFALYDGGSVFRAGMQLAAVPETHLKQAAFTRFSLVYGGPPYMSTAECDWSGVPPPSSFRALKIAAVAPAAPARAMLALKANTTNSNAQTYVALVRTDLEPSPGRELVVRTKRSIAALDVLRLRSRLSLARSGSASAASKPWDLLTLSFPEVAKTDWRAQQSDRLAVQEVYLEWLHAHVGHPARTPVLKSMDIGSGLHVTLEDMTPLTARLSHKGLNLKYATGKRLPTPSGSVATKICALQYVQRTLLVAACWGAAVYLYEGLPADVVAGRARPRLLVRFGPTARVVGMRFFGGFTSAPEEPPCSGKIVLAVTLRAGFVHVVQFTTADLNAPVEWAIPAGVKLQAATPGTVGWGSEWTAAADGTMQG
ncbi:hypothetical protein AURDEDRAFT_116995 [Auricularia subglabra TFB-10046 SS5]|nr:hypothetical protein AURDEDRAFT_116995 [Auricularia subglabra TFB-10046 SS5]